jgi:hypothetical protein
MYAAVQWKEVMPIEPREQHWEEINITANVTVVLFLEVKISKIVFKNIHLDKVG